MKAIIYARILERISFILMPLSVIGLFAKWGYDSLINFFHINPDHTYATLIKNAHILFWQSKHLDLEINTMPLFHKFLGLCVDSVSLGLFFAGLWQFILFTQFIQKRELFSISVISHLNMISRFALAWAMYEPIKNALLSVITSWHKGSGNRILAVEFGSSDIFNILLFCFFVLITAIVQEAYSLKKEQDLTI